MPEIARSQEGTFCWFEIVSPDLAAAKSFYGELFGWSFEEVAVPAGMPFTVVTAKADGKNVGGIRTVTAEALKVPPHLLSYLAVDDVDAAALRVPQLGGLVRIPPMDVTTGRMAVVQDPQGAVFALWQEKKSAGPWLFREPRALSWNELMTTDTEKAAAFYSELFEWSTKTMRMGPTSYTLFALQGQNVGGMMALPKEAAGAPPAWVCYVQVTDADHVIEKAQTMGGRKLAPAMEVEGVGRFAMLQDPQGCVFAVLQPASALAEQPST